ncbi:MAG TPA: hypothetical protein VFZ66_16070 [Herpetosiphonaceae bacterium]
MMYRWISWLLGSLLLLTNIHPAAAQTASVRLTVQPFFDGKYRAGNWLPFRITVSNNGPDITADISIQTGTSFATTLDLPRGAEKSVVLYARPLDEIRRTAMVRALVSGAELAKVEAPIDGFSGLTWVVGHVSTQALTLPLPAVQSQSQRLETLPIQPADLPERSEGLSMFDLLIVDGAPLADLTEKQQQALADWVRLGGQLVIGGTNLEATLAQLPEPLRPATSGGAAPRGSISLLPDLDAAGTPAVTALVGQASTRTIATIDSTPIGVQAEVGKGRVTALGFSFSAPELTQLRTAASLWDQIAYFSSSAVQAQQMQHVDDVQAQQFASVLSLLPALAVPPLTTLAVVLGLYLLIVGPGLYLLLRRLDRQAWGWVAVPLVTIVFSLGAYGYGLRLRGNDIILNQVTVVEPAEGRARVRTYAGIFSPRTQTYQVRTNSDVLFEPVAGGGFGQGGAFAGGQYMQGSSSVRNLNIPQWSMQMFTAQQVMDVDPLKAELTVEGTTLRGTVRNVGAEPIREVAVVHDVHVAHLGDLEPGQARPIEMKLEGAAFDRNVGIAGRLLRDKMTNFNRLGQLPVEVRMEQTVIDTIFNSLYDPPLGPVAVGWMERSPLAIEVEPSRLHRQQLTIIVAPAEVAFDQSGAISLERGWFNPIFEIDSAGIGGPCVTRSGDGWFLEGGIMTSTMQLPASLQSLQLDRAMIALDRDGPPSTMKLSVYDWAAKQWSEQPLSSNTATIEQPTRYFSGAGLLKARVEVQGDNAKGGGCVSVNLRVEGSRR